MRNLKTKRRVLEGIVVSDKMEKTIVVQVQTRVMHPLYKKFVKKALKVKAHDPKGEAKNGERVKIIESRPYSKDKHFLLLGVVK